MTARNSTAQIVSIHSFRRGTGKTSLAANLAVLLAVDARRVGVIDTNVQSPSLHMLFGLDEDKISYTFNDYLRARCDITQSAYDVTPNLGLRTPTQGQIYLIPASTQISEITQMLREGYDIDSLNDGLARLIDVLVLDVLVVDTYAGLNEATLLSMAIADSLLVVMRLDQQDYQGTAVIVDVAQKLDVPRVMLVVNQVPKGFSLEQVKAQVEQTFGCPVAALLPHSEEMSALASADIFVLHCPTHPLAIKLKQTAAAVLLP